MHVKKITYTALKYRFSSQSLEIRMFFKHTAKTVHKEYANIHKSKEW